MNLCGVARALVDMAFDGVEAVAYAVFDFDEPADELWYRDQLMAKEAEEEVSEPARACPECLGQLIFCHEHDCSQLYAEHHPESSSSPLVSAGGGEPAASAHSPSASQAAGNQTCNRFPCCRIPAHKPHPRGLDWPDLEAAAKGLRAYGKKWHRKHYLQIADRLQIAADAMK